MDLKADVVAQFEFIGFRKNNIYEGYRPSHLILDNCLTTGKHNYYNIKGNDNGKIKGTITFISPEDYPYSLWIGKIIKMYEGKSLVGFATIIEILNPILIKDSGNK